MNTAMSKYTFSYLKLFKNQISKFSPNKYNMGNVIKCECIFWGLFTFRGFPARKPASADCDDEQSDPFYSTSPDGEPVLAE